MPLSEQGLFGAQYPLNPEGYGGPATPLLVEPRSGPDAPPSEDLMSHWIFDGTGLEFGDRIEGAMGGEVDSFHPGHPSPEVIDQVVFLSPYYNGPDQLIQAYTTYFMRPNGQMTFHAGSLGFRTVLPHHHGLQQMFRNILERMMG